MRAIDKIALRWITAESKKNSMIKVNKQLLFQVDILMEINRELRKTILDLKLKQNERSK